VTAYVLRRILLMVPTTLGVAVVIFALYHLAPGDPAVVMTGSVDSREGQADVDARIAGFRREHGLDRSVLVQFLDWVGPFNLSRDGHPWFTSPWTEREVTVEEWDGREVTLGVPLPIAPPPGLGDDASGERAYARLLTALHDLAPVPADRTEIERLSRELGELAGFDPDPGGELVAAGRHADLVRLWFGWYYTHGGARVRNSGEKPWGGLLALDLGREMERKTPVAAEIRRRLEVTVPLSLAAALLAYLIAIPLGIQSARSHGTKRDALATLVLFVLYSIPTFWAGLMLVLLFGATGLDLLPVLGLTAKDHDELDAWGKLVDVLRHAILPVVTLTYVQVAFLSRQMRVGMLEVIGQDYIRTARAKGLSERVVVYKHALRNSLIPIVTLFASMLPALIGGSVVVETVFDIPGMGKYAYEGLLRRDFYIVMATTILVGVTTQVGILLSDVAYALVDPRIRHD